jgi:hypothetical protein
MSSEILWGIYSCKLGFCTKILYNLIMKYREVNSIAYFDEELEVDTSYTLVKIVPLGYKTSE